MKSQQKLRQLWNSFKTKQVNAEFISASCITSVRARSELMEVKHRIGKPILKFPLENWMVKDDDVCVGRWVETNDNVYGSPIGGYSWGVWWVGVLQQGHVGVGAYRIHDSHGNLISYRLDVLKCAKILDNTVEFNDLVMDAYIWPPMDATSTTGVDSSHLEVTIEDGEELEELCISGDIPTVESDLIKSVITDVVNNPGKYRDAIDTAIQSAKESVVCGKGLIL